MFILGRVHVRLMPKLRCADYGFECDFISEGDNDKVLHEFAKHTNDEHGIEYSNEVLMQFIMRKQDSD